jgi:hypothetical protein
VRGRGHSLSPGGTPTRQGFSPRPLAEHPTHSRGGPRISQKMECFGCYLAREKAPLESIYYPPIIAMAAPKKRRTTTCVSLGEVVGLPVRAPGYSHLAKDNLTRSVEASKPAP